MSLASDRRLPTFSDADGTVLESAGDRYEFVESLAYGVLADVTLALRTGHHGADSLVVVKRLRKSLADDPTTAELFLNEGRISMKLRHPNVVQSLAMGEEGGRPFLVMEFIEGETLQSLLGELAARSLRLPPALAAYVAAELARGLHYAHELKDIDGSPLRIVHRDVSPHNVLLGADGSVKLIDFGIAKTVLPREATAQGVTKGKLAYMAPEQVLGQKLDGRADVFALGIVLWEMVTGERLMLGTSMFETMDRILKGEMPLASSVTAHVPPDLDAIIARALAKDREERYGSADEMRLALRAFLRAEAPTIGSDELARLQDSLFGDKLAEQRARRQAVVAMRRQNPAPSGPAPAGRSRSSVPSRSPSSGLRRLEGGSVLDDDTSDPWSQPTARYALTADDGSTYSQRTTLPTHIPQELLRASIESMTPSRRSLTDVRRDMSSSSLALTPRESLSPRSVDPVSLGPLSIVRAPTLFPDDEPSPPAEGAVRESGDVPRAVSPSLSRMPQGRKRTRSVPPKASTEPVSEIFVQPPLPPPSAWRRAQTLLEARTRSSAATWFVAIAVLVLLTCLAAIAAHPRVRGALRGAARTVPALPAAR